MLEQLKKVYRTVREGGPAALPFEVDGETYIRNFTPPERLILLGCGHIGQALHVPVAAHRGDVPPGQHQESP